MAENYCVMNMAKRHRSDVRGLQDEANRAYEDESQYKGNVDLSRSKDNVYFVRSDDWHKSIDEVLKANDVKEKASSVVLITSVYAVSPDWLKTHTQDEALAYFKACYEYEKKTKGEVINAVIHRDEDSWHMQTATVPVVDVVTEKAVPIVKELDENGEPVYERYEKGKMAGEIKYKRVKVKDENGNLVTHKGLSAKTVVGNRVAMSKRQTEFWQECGKPFGMKRGEIRIEDDVTARERLTESEYRAKAIKDEAQKKADKTLSEAKERVDSMELEASNKLWDAEMRMQEVRRQLVELEDAREALTDDREAFEEERDAFTVEKQKWLKTQNTALQQVRKAEADAKTAKTAYEDAKADYETAKTGYESAKATAELATSGFALKDTKSYLDAFREAIRQECRRTRYKDGRTLWDIVGQRVSEAISFAYMNVSGKESPAFVKRAEEQAEYAERTVKESSNIDKVRREFRALPKVADAMQKTDEDEYSM